MIATPGTVWISADVGALIATRPDEPADDAPIASSETLAALDATLCRLRAEREALAPMWEHIRANPVPTPARDEP